MSTVDSEKVIDYYVNRLNKAKWQVTFRTESGVQVKKLKRVNPLGVWAGLVLLPFWGIGFVIWLLVILDYFFQQERLHFITVNKMIEQLKGG